MGLFVYDVLLVVEPEENVSPRKVNAAIKTAMNSEFESISFSRQISAELPRYVSMDIDSFTVRDAKKKPDKRLHTTHQYRHRLTFRVSPYEPVAAREIRGAIATALRKEMDGRDWGISIDEWLSPRVALDIEHVRVTPVAGEKKNAGRKAKPTTQARLQAERANGRRPTRARSERDKSVTPGQCSALRSGRTSEMTLMDLVVEDWRGNRWGVKQERGLRFYVRTPQGDRWIPMTKDDVVMSTRTAMINKASPALRDELIRSFGRGRPRPGLENGKRGNRSTGARSEKKQKRNQRSVLGAALRKDK